MVEPWSAKRSQAKFFIMIANDINQSRQKKLVPPDKFDRHMVRARQTDISSRKHIFSQQTERENERQEQRQSIKSSIY